MLARGMDDQGHFEAEATPGHGVAVGARRDPATGQVSRQAESFASDPFGASRRVLSARRRQRWWLVALWVLGTIVLALVAVTVGVTIRHHSHSSGPAASASSGTSAPRHAGASATTTGSPGTPGGPTISSLTPDQGPVGQQVVIAGSGLMSSDGQVLAHFGAVIAPTSCPQTTTCTATAPPGPVSGTQVPLTVSTAGGTSNSLTFTYK